MSELSAILGGKNATVLPGHTLSRFRARDYAEVEEEFITQYLEVVAKAAARVPKAAGELLVSKAAAAVAAGHLAHGTLEYSIRCFAEIWLPYLLWVCLKIAEPTITKAQAESLVTEDNRDVVHDAVLECMRFKKKSDPNARGVAANDPTNPPPTPGDKSSESSASAA